MKDTGYYSGNTLGGLRLTWYSNIQPAKTVEIVNYVHEKALSGEQVFFDIYTEEEKAADPLKKDTGLFFFRGMPGAKVAICNAGGGFAYVRMTESPAIEQWSAGLLPFRRTARMP